MKIKVNGQEYMVAQQGAGQPTWLLLHGFMGSHADFEQITAELPGQVLTVDLLGHGQTTASHDPWDYSMDQQVADLGEILTQLEIDRANVVGYSMGGRLALGFALDYPELVDKLFLESSTAGIADDHQRRQRVEKDELQARQLEREPFTKFIDHWEQLPLFTSQRQLPEEQQAVIRAQRLAQDPLALAASLRGMGTGSMPNFWEVLPRLQCPTTLIAGELDQKFQRITAKMADLLPDAKRVVVTGAGHNVHQERPAAYLRILKGEQ